MFRNILLFIAIPSISGFIINPILYTSTKIINCNKQITNRDNKSIENITHEYKNNYKNNYKSNYKNIYKSNNKINRINYNKSPMLLINDVPPPDESIKLLDRILDITIRDKYLGKIIVETISAQLPNVDSIGHNVLRANNEFINTILNNPNLSEVMKKNIVLASIKLAIAGDNMGSILLQLYYDIVDKCL